jgi:hypothetical protein
LIATSAAGRIAVAPAKVDYDSIGSFINFAQLATATPRKSHVLLGILKEMGYQDPYTNKNNTVDILQSTRGGHPVVHPQKYLSSSNLQD